MKNLFAIVIACLLLGCAAPQRNNTIVGSAGANASDGEGRTALRQITIYQAEIPFHIRRHWAYSEQMAGGQKDLAAWIIIKIMPNGEIADIWFEKKSGNTYFDESAFNAVKKSSPLPPLPKGYNKPFMDLGLRFIPRNNTIAGQSAGVVMGQEAFETQMNKARTTKKFEEDRAVLTALLGVQGAAKVEDAIARNLAAKELAREYGYTEAEIEATFGATAPDSAFDPDDPGVLNDAQLKRFPLILLKEKRTK